MKKVFCILLITCLFLGGCSDVTSNETMPTDTAPTENQLKVEVIDIINETKETVDIMIIAPFYEDNLYEYYFSSPSITYTVIYSDGTRENVRNALEKGKITIADLDRYNVQYGKELKIAP